MSATLRSRLSLYLTTLCAVAYALVAHLAIATESIGLTIAAVALLAGTTLIPPLLHGRTGAWIGIPITAVACWLLSKADAPILMLYLPPMLGTLFMAWVFGHTLSAGRTPLISQIVKLMHPAELQPEPAVWDYARRLTQAWTLLFLVLTGIDFALALVVVPDGLLEMAGLAAPLSISQEAWSLFANVIQYLIVAGFFVAEYFYRSRRFPDQPYRGLVDFLRRALAASPKLLAGEEPQQTKGER